MKSHTHTCPVCEEPFTCHAEVISNPDGWPEALCSAEAGHYEVLKPMCDDCTSEQGEIRDAMRLEA